MGKIRVKTIGDESAEKEQKQEAKKRKEARKIEDKKTDSLAQSSSNASGVSDAAAPDDRGVKPSTKQSPKEKGIVAETAEKPAAKAEEAPREEKKKEKKEKFLKKKVRSQKYQAALGQVDKKKVYSLKEALELLPKLKVASFDETVELHINTTEVGVNGSMVLPHGTGKKMRIAIVNPTADPKATDELIRQVEAGKINFDILVATPDAMPRLARVAKFLGPRGLMPNPKNGTITQKPEEVAKKYEGGQMNFKTEAKSPILHLTVGKVSFGDKKLTDNIKTVITTVQTNRIKNVTMKSTMSPGIKIDFSLL